MPYLTVKFFLLNCKFILKTTSENWGTWHVDKHQLGQEAEEENPDVEKGVPELVLELRRVLQVEDEEVPAGRHRVAEHKDLQPVTKLI
jgi:hypothetical protein